VEHSLLVPSGAKHRKEGAQLIGFLTSAEAQSHYSLRVGGKIPARKSVTNDPAYRDTITKNPHFGAFLEQLKTARPLPAKSSEFVKAMSIVSDAVNSVLNGQDAGKIARETQQQLAALYKQ
jgi:ABC-type glycerol-3-phosphate transport system substrate-binding protein